MRLKIIIENKYRSVFYPEHFCFDILVVMRFEFLTSYILLKSFITKQILVTYSNIFI